MAMVPNPTDAARWLRVGATFQGYVIESPIGVGGMSEVYRARHAFLGHRVALKVLQLRRATNARLVGLATAEARALAHLRHENLVHVIDAGMSEGGIVWMVMPLLEGLTLRDYLPRYDVSVLDALRFCRDICDGVQAAHEAGIIHRDLKPENVFVTKEHRIVVIDLGMAKFQDFGLASTGSGPPLGTVRYMSPEHMGGERVDARTDVYAVGVMLHEMLAGEHPFHRGKDGQPLDNTQIGWAIMGRAPEPLRSLRPEVPAYVESIALRAMAKNREDRPPTITALASELRRARAEASAELAALPPGHTRAQRHVPDAPGQRQVYIPAQTGPEPLPIPRMPSRRVVLEGQDARPPSETQPLGWAPGQATPAPAERPVPLATTEPLSDALAAWAVAQHRRAPAGHATEELAGAEDPGDSDGSAEAGAPRVAGWFRPASATESRTSQPPSRSEARDPGAPRPKAARWTARHGLVVLGIPLLMAGGYVWLAGEGTRPSEARATPPASAAAVSGPAPTGPVASAEVDGGTPAVPSATAVASAATPAPPTTAPRPAPRPAPAANGEVHGASKF